MPSLRLEPSLAAVAAADTGVQLGRRLHDLTGFPGAGPAPGPSAASPSVEDAGGKFELQLQHAVISMAIAHSMVATALCSYAGLTVPSLFLMPPGVAPPLQEAG